MVGTGAGRAVLTPVLGGASEVLEVLCAAAVVVEGTVDVLRPAVKGGARLWRGFTAAVVVMGLLPAGGVLVREVLALETPLLPSCFVGDFAGDLIPLNLGLGAGVGLAPSVLPLFPGPSARLCLFNPLTPACTLLGLAFPGTPLPAVLDLGFTSSKTWRTPEGLKNMP